MIYERISHPALKMCLNNLQFTGLLFKKRETSYFTSRTGISNHLDMAARVIRVDALVILY